jgi:ankyrin repeat protein
MSSTTNNKTTKSSTTTTITTQQQQQESARKLLAPITNTTNTTTKIDKWKVNSELYQLCFNAEWNWIRVLLPDATDEQINYEYNGFNVLSTAIFRKMPSDLFHLLLWRGAACRINSIVCQQRVALDYALTLWQNGFSGEEDFIFINKKKKINRNDTEDFNTKEDFNNLTQIIILLIKYGADLSISILVEYKKFFQLPERNNKPWPENIQLPVLHFVLLCENLLSTELLTVIVEHWENMDQQDVEGRTPLELAISSRSVDFVSIVLEAGADPNLAISGGDKLTSIDYALELGSNAQIIMILFKFGGNFHSEYRDWLKNDRYMSQLLNNPPPPSKSRLHMRCQNCHRISPQHKPFSKCKGCEHVWYCGSECSRQDWPQHKIQCNYKSSKKSTSMQQQQQQLPKQYLSKNESTKDEMNYDPDDNDEKMLHFSGM